MNKDAEGRWKVGMSNITLKMRVKEIPAHMQERAAGHSSIGSRAAVYYMVRVLLGVLVNVIKYERRFHTGAKG